MGINVERIMQVINKHMKSNKTYILIISNINNLTWCCIDVVSCDIGVFNKATRGGSRMVKDDGRSSID